MLITCFPVGNPRFTKSFTKNIHGRTKKAEIIWLTSHGNIAVGTFRRLTKTTAEVVNISVCVIKPRKNRARIAKSVPKIGGSVDKMLDKLSNNALNLAAMKRNMVCDV